MNALASLPPDMRAGLAALAEMARCSASPHAMFNLGTVHMHAGDLTAAEAWFREALALDPDLPEAHQNLAAVLQDTGRTAEASQHRDRAFRHAPVRIEAAPDEQCRVLVLAGAGYGNTPIETLLPRATTTRIKLFVAYASAADWATLPAYDVIFNAIGDADLLPDSAWQDQIAAAGRQVLNPPDRVARTRRDRLPGLLAGIQDLLVPRVERTATLPTSLHFPIITREVGAHGGQGVTLAHTPDEFTANPATRYFTEFHDYRCADGYFRKYRMIFVGGALFPCHLAISSNWLVHYFSADMQASAWKREEERRFLENPQTVLGRRAMAALTSVAARLGLDYAGIDFAVLQDGRVLLFEANTTMIVHLDDCPILFDYKHRATKKILAAFTTLCQKTGS